MKLLLSKNAGKRKFVLQLCTGCLVAVAVVPLATAQERVTNVRFWSLGDVTRIAVESSGAFGVKSDRLSNPDRVFFDLIGTVPALGTRGIKVIAVDDTLVKQIRVAETQRGTTRVVVDLAAPVAISRSILTNPDRLMIELREAGTAPPSAPEPVEPSVPLRKFQPPFMPKPDLTRRWPAPQLDAPAPLPVGFAIPYAPRYEMFSRLSAPPPPPRADLPIRTSPAVAARVVRTESLEPPIAPRASQTAIPLASAPAPDRLGLPAKRPNIGANETMIRALGLKVGRIVIDAGHGGHDVGSIGPGGMLEKDLVLDIARRVGALLEQHLACEVVYTRTDDTFIPLEERTRIANASHADLFLSIHANSSSLRTASGVETYYLNFTTARTALEVAARENATAQKKVFELQDLLQKIALKDKVDESREFASRIQTALYTMSAKGSSRTRDRGVRKAPFVVLIGASMPSVLAEVGFISNPREEAAMKRAEQREKIAEALYKGVASYASTLSHFQVAQSRLR